MNRKLVQRSGFARLRYQYYAGGRILFFSNCMAMGALMLGYAIESSLKHALNERGFRNRRILYSHDLRLLFQTCRDQDAFLDVEVSPDLLEFADDLFDQRYPSQMHSRSEDMIKRNRQIMMTPSILIAYDDLLIQLDSSLWRLTEDHQSSVGIIAALASTCLDARVFFHCNAPALTQLDRYLETLRTYHPWSVDEIEQLERGVDHLYNYDGVHVTFAPIGQLRAAQPAKQFRYPGRIVRNPQGRIVHSFASTNFLGGAGGSMA